MEKDDYIKKTIQLLEDRKIQLGIELDSTKAAIYFLSQLSMEHQPRARLKTEPDTRLLRAGLKTKRLQQRKCKRHKAGSGSPVGQETARRASKKPFSKYKGVTKGRTKNDGTLTFRANVWMNGKNIVVGTFDSEIDAAAAIEQFKAELAETNTGQLKSKPAGINTAYKCKGCGQVYHAINQPQKCVKCDRAAFDKVEEPILKT